MGRPTTKEELISAAKVNFDKLLQTIATMPEDALNTDFDFSADLKKKEAHWQRDKNTKDILIHLYEWHQLLLNWINSNLKGTKSPFIPLPYTWKTYGDMNIEFWKKHQNTSFEISKEMVNESHEKVIALVHSFSNEALFTKKYFDWTGTTSLGSYCVSAMPSHYDWATKKLRLHIKKVQK